MHLDTIPKHPPASDPFVPEPLPDSDQAAAIMDIHSKTLQKLARQGETRGAQMGKLVLSSVSHQGMDRSADGQLKSTRPLPGRPYP